MDKRRLSVVAAATLALGLAATSAAAAYTSVWKSTPYESTQLSCGLRESGPSSASAYIDTNGCDWAVSIRAKWNELGTNYTTAWVPGNGMAVVARDRIYQYQYRY